jgi:hypothetical protein
LGLWWIPTRQKRGKEQTWQEKGSQAVLLQPISLSSEEVLLSPELAFTVKIFFLKTNRFHRLLDYQLDFTLYLIGIHSLKDEIDSFHPFLHFAFRFSQVFQTIGGYGLSIGFSIDISIKKYFDCLCLLILNLCYFM